MEYSTLASLPNEVLCDIVLYLDPVSAVVFARCCRSALSLFITCKEDIRAIAIRTGTAAPCDKCLRLLPRKKLTSVNTLLLLRWEAHVYNFTCCYGCKQKYMRESVNNANKYALEYLAAGGVNTNLAMGITSRYRKCCKKPTSADELYLRSRVLFL